MFTKICHFRKCTLSISWLLSSCTIVQTGSTFMVFRKHFLEWYLPAKRSLKMSEMAFCKRTPCTVYCSLRTKPQETPLYLAGWRGSLCALHGARFSRKSNLTQWESLSRPRGRKLLTLDTNASSDAHFFLGWEVSRFARLFDIYIIVIRALSEWSSSCGWAIKVTIKNCCSLSIREKRENSRIIQMSGFRVLQSKSWKLRLFACFWFVM